MVSPELLRRYPFFAFMSHEQLRQVAMITEEISAAAGETLFSEGGPVRALYLLLSGNVDLHHIVEVGRNPPVRKDFPVGSINPGEPLAISAVIEPYELSATAVVTMPSRLLKIDAQALRALADQDVSLCLALQKMAAKATMERLHATRIQLAAANGALEGH
jgi:CRP/FNR family transcriptional regulator, cyclic AMP receptor protein